MDAYELEQKIKEISPDAQFETDNDGQIIIYTNKILITDNDNPSIPAGENLIVDFFPSEK